MLKNIFIIELEIIFFDIYEKSTSIGVIESLLSNYGFNLWEISYIGKFPTNKYNRINFIDVQFVNLNMLKKKNFFNSYKNSFKVFGCGAWI